MLETSKHRCKNPAFVRASWWLTAIDLYGGVSSGWRPAATEESFPVSAAKVIVPPWLGRVRRQQIEPSGTLGRTKRYYHQRIQRRRDSFRRHPFGYPKSGCTRPTFCDGAKKRRADAMWKRKYDCPVCLRAVWGDVGYPMVCF